MTNEKEITEDIIDLVERPEGEGISNHEAPEDEEVE